MELVCIGLSKNPYLSVQQKREHIEWYRNYFEEKRDILQRVIDENKKAASQINDGAQSTQSFWLLFYLNCKVVYDKTEGRDNKKNTE